MKYIFWRFEGFKVNVYQPRFNSMFYLTRYFQMDRTNIFSFYLIEKKTSLEQKSNLTMSPLSCQLNDNK